MKDLHHTGSQPWSRLGWEQGSFFFLFAISHCCVAAPVSLRRSLNDSVLVLQLLKVCVGMLQLVPIKKDNGF